MRKSNIRISFPLCIHEAGHAMVAKAMGLVPQAVVVDLASGYGAALYNDHPDPTRQAVVTSAGAAAEALVCGRVRHATWDGVKVRALLGLCCVPRDLDGWSAVPAFAEATSAVKRLRFRLLALAVRLWVSALLAAAQGKPSAIVVLSRNR